MKKRSDMKRFIIKDPEGLLSNSVDDFEVDFTVPSHQNLQQICETLTLFLKASGYVFNGYVDIVDYDDLK